MFDVYDVSDKVIARHTLLRDAIAVLVAVDLAAYLIERETNITLTIDKDANKLRFMLGAKGN
jgi:hypothetical protein